MIPHLPPPASASPGPWAYKYLACSGRALDWNREPSHVGQPCRVSYFTSEPPSGTMRVPSDPFFSSTMLSSGRGAQKKAKDEYSLALLSQERNKKCINCYKPRKTEQEDPSSTNAPGGRTALLADVDTEVQRGENTCSSSSNQSQLQVGTGRQGALDVHQECHTQAPREPKGKESWTCSQGRAPWDPL